MMRIARFRPEVAGDLSEAIDWYDSRRSGLGEEFVSEYWSTIDRITAHPFAYAINETGLRACRLGRFPYVVHYRFSEAELLIVAVMFGGRDTSGWIDRV